MNNVIWFVYLGGISEGLMTIMILTGLVLAIIGGIRCLINSDSYRGDPKLDVKRYFIAGFAMMLIATFVPSKEVFYAMAAEQITSAQTLEHTDNKALQALNRWLDKEIQETDSSK